MFLARIPPNFAASYLILIIYLPVEASAKRTIAFLGATQERLIYGWSQLSYETVDNDQIFKFIICNFAVSGLKGTDYSILNSENLSKEAGHDRPTAESLPKNLHSIRSSNFEVKQSVSVVHLVELNELGKRFCESHDSV